MSIRVNLLPASIKERERARRGNAILALLVLVFVGVLVLVYFAKSASVDNAIDQRDMAQVEVNNLQAQVQALAAFQALADELNTGNATLALAMQDELAVARLLNDVALSMPGTASLTDLSVARGLQAGEEGGVSLGTTVANLQMAGYSIERYAPGVEGVLLQFDQVNGLIITYLNTASTNEIGDVGVTTFDATGLLTQEIFTERYIDGLPELAQ